MKTITAAQARFIAATLAALDSLPFVADGQFLRVDLMDELFDAPVGHFTNEEGTWLFEIRDEPARKPATVREIAQSVFDSNPNYYRDHKIGFINGLRARWNEVTAQTLSLVDAKNVVEQIAADEALQSLREKLGAEETSWGDEDRAYAEHRERLAEQGTWFGAPGPMDEEPF